MKTIIIKSFSDYLEQTCSDSFDGFIFRGVPDADAHQLIPSIGRLKKFQGVPSATITKEEKHWPPFRRFYSSRKPPNPAYLPFKQCSISLFKKS